MTAITKFHSSILAITTLIVFMAWSKLQVLIELNSYLKIAIFPLISLGVYQSCVKLLLLFLKKNKYVKKFFLGPKYMEGTWVGYYIGHQGKVRFIVERYEQDLEKLVVRGFAYNENLEQHTSWVSSSSNINVERGELIYSYDLKGINETSNGSGVAVFNFDRTEMEAVPNEIEGFSADLHNGGKRMSSIEYKLSDSNSIGKDLAIQKAKEFYEKKKKGSKQETAV